LHNHLSPPAIELWGRATTHSVEQQLALLGWTGVPVTDLPRTRLTVTEGAAQSLSEKLRANAIGDEDPIALIHPSTLFETKQWATEKFARVIEYLASRGFKCVAVVGRDETQVIARLREDSAAQFASFSDLPLPQVTALASRAKLFVGNDSGIAHIAAAVGTPTVVIFGSSNVDHWRPWASAPAEVVLEVLPCQPCPGYTCEEFGVPECIRRVPVENVIAAIERVSKKDS
jgi:ADP-heptose:LPS heptosyltransferase